MLSWYAVSMKLTKTQAQAIIDLIDIEFGGLEEWGDLRIKYDFNRKGDCVIVWDGPFEWTITFSDALYRIEGDGNLPVYLRGLFFEPINSAQMGVYDA